MTEKSQQGVQTAGEPVLCAECDPSLKSAFMGRLRVSGFRTQADAIRTLARDLVAGKIRYKGGVLQCQQENSQPDPVKGQGSHEDIGSFSM